MVSSRLSVALDANVLVAGTRLPRWPFEVMQASIGGPFELVIPEQVVVEARRNVPADRLWVLDRFLAVAGARSAAAPADEVVWANLDLVRSRRDVPIAIALLDEGVDVFVTNDRDFTDEGATAARFREKVQVMLPAVFLRDVVGWTSAELEAIRTRTWDKFVDPFVPAPKD